MKSAAFLAIVFSGGRSAPREFPTPRLFYHANNRGCVMTIADLHLTGLSGGTVEGGWAKELTPEDNVHTIVEVVTDEGLVGVGSTFTSRDLVAAAAKLLAPLLLGERADEPARVSEKLRQHTFWQGRGGAVEHAISGIDVALWDLFGKVTGQPVARLLGGVYRTRIKPYGSLLFDEVDA